MNRTRIKICGICRPQDALAAARAGADAIGLVLHSKSDRLLTVEKANKIISVLPPFVTVTGLFVDAELELLDWILSKVPIQLIQMQGHESPELIAALKPIPVVKALHVDENTTSALRSWRKAIARFKLTNLKALLLDSAGPEAGGTGIPNDWKAIYRLQTSGALDGLPPLMAAGGLTPQNVGQVVQLLRPYAVDVSSGVESGRRKKSRDKIEQFIRAVRAADQS